MRKRRRTCTTIYLGSNDKRFEYVTDGNVKLADSVTIERWVVRLMACTKAWMRLDADGMRTIHGTRIEGLLNIELQWLAELTKARTIESEAFSVDDDDDDDDGDDKLKLRPLTARAIVAAEKDLDKRFADFEVAGEAVTCVWEDEDFGSLGKDIPQRLKQLGLNARHCGRLRILPKIGLRQWRYLNSGCLRRWLPGCLPLSAGTSVPLPAF